jgi:single-strand DNA-binding protein
MTQLVGVFRIGKDAEIREVKGKSVINLVMAYNYGMKDDGGNRPTQWVDASLWGARAEKLEQYLLKGQQVYAVINDAHIETFEKRDGGSGFKLTGTIGEIELVGGKPQGSGERAERAPARREPERRAPAAKPAATGGFDDMDDDIPF